MPIEKRPHSPLPKGLPHGSSTRHRVGDNETFEGVARMYHVPIDHLLKHNFGTTDPAEINWYLREHVGCNLPTHDHKNWRFSSSARPGFIYIPRQPLWMEPMTIIGRRPAPPPPASQVHGIAALPATSLYFSIRMEMAFSAGEVGNGDVVYFIIRNETNHTEAKYLYVGANIGLGTPASGTAAGPPNYFYVSRPLTANQFTGWGMVGSMGGLEYTKTYLMVPTPEGMPNVKIAPFKTGPTLGIGVNPVGAGRFCLVSPVPLKSPLQ